MDKRITIHSARISIYFLQNSKCIINILAEEVGELHKGKKEAFFFVGRKILKFLLSFFFTLKMHEHNIYFSQRWGFCSAFQKEQEITFKFLV